MIKPKEITVYLDDANHPHTEEEHDLLQQSLGDLSKFLSVHKYYPSQNMYFKNKNFDNYYFDRFVFDMETDSVDCYISFKK